MHVNAKRITFLGLLLSVSVILLILGGTIQASTLFLLAAASFCVGIVVREYGIGMGLAFFIANSILGFLFMPDKMLLITFVAMALYILLSEAAWLLLCKKIDTASVNRMIQIYWGIRFIIFNLIYLPIVIFAPQLIIAHTITPVYFVVMVAAGQFALFIFEKAYCYFQAKVWNKFRKFLNT